MWPYTAVLNYGVRVNKVKLLTSESEYSYKYNHDEKRAQTDNVE